MSYTFGPADPKEVAWFWFLKGWKGSQYFYDDEGRGEPMYLEESAREEFEPAYEAAVKKAEQEYRDWR